MESFREIDPYIQKAYCEEVTFDIKDKNIKGSLNVIEANDVYHTPELSVKKKPMKEWELDVRPLISSKKWLQNYNLKKNRLDMESLLPVIGFKLSDDYDHTLKRPVASKYGSGMFSQIFHKDGKTYNITCSREKLKQLESRLLQAIQLYKRRLEWLTTESRRMFGIVEEKGLTIVLDIRNMSPQQFDQYRTALERVIREQLSQVSKFNLIRATEDIESYQEECVPVTHDTLDSAVQWLWNLDRLAPVSNTSVCEAVMKAFGDKNNEAVYLYTEGNAMDSCQELMIGKISSREDKVPLHIVSFNCNNSDTIKYLKHLATLSSGKFHAYAVVMEIDAYEAMPVDTNTNRANILLKKKTYGGIPSGAGVREDVILVFEELERARYALAQIQSVMQIVPDPKTFAEKVREEEEPPVEKDEQYMSSKDWIERYGLGKRKLELYDILAGVAFKHSDGVVDILEKPPNEMIHTDAVQRTKLVNATYCDKFPVVRWKNGEVVHVQVTPEIHRLYEQKMTVALNQIYQRLDWLKKGSRALFGTVVENNIYILIDTSDSMTPHLKFLKDKIHILMQEQLRHKMKFNLVAFNTKAVPWRDRLVEVNEMSLKSAWKWIQGLSSWGSTNTYAALQQALGDPKTEAVYLLTDGRPDQPPKSIIAQVQMQNRVPIHTISFNCSDTEANQFLTELSEATSGRFHYFSEGGLDDEQPQSWESEDVKVLKDEIKRGFEDLDKVAELRDECAKISWKQEVDSLRCSRNHDLPVSGKVSAVPSMDTKDLYRPSPPTTPRPQSAPPDRFNHVSSPQNRPMSAIGYRTTSRSSLRHSSIVMERPRSAKGARTVHPTHSVGKIGRPVNVAGHTKSSLLRTLGNSGKFNPNDWLLPESRELFEKQAKKQRELAQDDKKKEKFQRIRRKQYLQMNQTSTKRWLQKHGLAARKLTLLDALAPTFVSHKATYVPILDKHVVSKVFDEVLPLAHVSGKSSQKIQLINPNGVNLIAYEDTLQKTINKYQRHLDNMVWKALSDSSKAEFDSTEPVKFEENKLKIMQALDASGWPIQEKDVLLMEKEIAKGNKYLKQSQELRKAADTSRGADDDEEERFGETFPEPNDDNFIISEVGMSQREYERSTGNLQNQLFYKLDQWIG